MVKLLMLLVLLKGLAIEVDVLGTRLRLLGRFAAGLLRLRVLALLLRVGQGLGGRSLGAGLGGGLGSGEARLLRTLLAGPQPDGAQLQLALPSALVAGPLLAEGRLRAIAERSGSRLELGAEYSPPPTQLLTITGSMLGNSMAILYIQELMQQLGVLT
mmetsp:Transcript_75316/g.191068  ORF Transcript_75316/g.191068 Transcript_75316/m.191068 type:complete len:158 (+) Transcript_75316:565-1038(+)